MTINTENMRVWNPMEGDLVQGDVLLFSVPSNVKINRTAEIPSKQNGERLVLAEGEVLGHLHSIFSGTAVTHYRFNEGEGGVIEKGITIEETNALLKSVTKSEAKASYGVAKLYKDAEAVDKLVKAGELTTNTLAIGFLEVTDAPVILTHDEHNPIQIPCGLYYVGGQQEFDAAQARRVAD